MLISSKALSYYRLAVAVLLAASLAGCAGINAGYKTPAPRSQIAYEVVPITPDTASELQRQAPPVSSMQLDSIESSGVYKYLIGPGDVLSIFIAGLNFRQDDGVGAAEVQTQYVVSEQGEIFLPLHGPLNIAGLSPSEAYAGVRNAIARYITKPQINLRVIEFRSQRATVAGHVESPGFFPLTDRALTIPELIVLAGALPDSDLRQVVLNRDGRQRQIDVFAVMQSPNFGKELIARDGDVVLVPPNRNRVYVVGEAANRSQAIDPYDNSLADVLVGKVSQETSAAPGQNTNYLQEGAAKPSHVFVIRGNSAKATVHHLDASAPESFLLAQNFQLMDGDVVYVKTRRITQFNRFLSQIIPTIQSLLVPALIVDQLEN